ncbi:metal ABC transporter substrate-binding protein, partial [Nocardioides sp.]|uniref:metal ABC transporter substrate-binding protein n=1 Tax=Nocardioides sp. TaxID=35761 RepID=UPI002732FB2D
MASTRLPRSSPSRLLRTTAAAAVLPLFLAGCGALSEADPGASASESGGTGEIVAAFYPLQYVTQRVAGDAFEVTNLTGAGNEPHDLELTIRETAAISSASLVVYQRSFQPAVDAAVDNNSSGPVLDAADVVDLLPASDDHD